MSNGLPPTGSLDEEAFSMVKLFAWLPKILLNQVDWTKLASASTRLTSSLCKSGMCKNGASVHELVPFGRAGFFRPQAAQPS